MWHPDQGLDVQFFDLVADPFELDSAPQAPAAHGLATALAAALAEADDAWEGAAALADAYPAVTG